SQLGGIRIKKETERQKENSRQILLCDKVQMSWVNPLGVYDPSTALWLQGKGQDKQKEDLQAGQSAVLLAGRTEEFNRRLREQPADTQLWIQFIQYQVWRLWLLYATGNDSTEWRKSSYRAVLEKKLSIAERAVATNPGSVALQLERLRICQELWEPSVLAKEWKKLVFLHPNSTSLWRAYLLFTQSYFSNFTVSKVNSAYGKCLSTLSAVRDGTMVSHPALPGIEEDMLDIFTQQCHFLRQSGHTEKAISLFQAMMDFTFYKPDSVRELSTKQQVEFFEPFWDSGEARVGELGARGWKAWMVQQERGGWLQPKEEEDEEEEVKDRRQPRWTVWLDVESSREAAQWLPWRPDKSKGQSEEDCEDPDRQVLFDDIGPSLICLSSPELQLQLLLHFMSFLGLPVDSAFSLFLICDKRPCHVLGIDPLRPLTSHDLPDTGLNAVGHMTTLQGTKKWAGLGKQGETFITNVFNMVQAVLPVHHQAILSLSWIQYEKLKVLRCLRSGNKKRLRSQGKSSKRVAKRLLKESNNRSSLVLWREYAHLEWMLGNVDEARKVFSTATAMGGTKGLSSPSLCDLCLLWAQLEVENGVAVRGADLTDVTASPAVTVLTKLAEGTSTFSSSSDPLSPVSVLKARRSYEQILTDLLHLRLKGLVGCYALFQYLTVGIQAANAVYSQPNTLLRYHNSVSVFPLATLRQTLTSTLSTWCSSAPLWSIYVQVEDRYHSAGRARRFFHSVTRHTDSVVPRLFAIVVEQQRKQLVDAAQKSCCHDAALPILPENGLSNRIRGLFETAIATEIGAHCPLVWRMYMHFLGLYMDAVQLFPEHLQEFVDLMTEKELRLRLPLEELDILLED
uniref:NRDE-2, necessary for RNA interference, domain containing n=1 Tax=Mastacembelus armatus TaxID=205130 RepID=A0A3Q3S991_9TELE